MPRGLTIELLKNEAKVFAQKECRHKEPIIYGVTDGKAIGTYLEHKFHLYLAEKYKYKKGSSAKGIDFPDLAVDMKVTSTKQPQSSCPFSSSRQKVFGLGYGLLVFVYSKRDDGKTSTATLTIQHVIFVEKEYTGDYQMTKGILQILANGGNEDDLVAYMEDRFLVLDESASRTLAREILKKPPSQGYITLSNALQWRLQYSRTIQKAGTVDGVYRVL